jgi:hypothetical protein
MADHSDFELKRLLKQYKSTGDWGPIAKFLWTRPPECCFCGGKDDRPDDPWEMYSCSTTGGPDWMHRCCIERFHRAAEKMSARPIR